MNKIQSLYIHFPFCIRKCSYCDFHSLKKADDDWSWYHEYLESSMRSHQSLLDKNSYTFGELKTFYIGGGTPSLWGRKGADFLSVFLKNWNINFSSDIEATLEINPATGFEKDQKRWEEIGINRFSVGVQSVNDDYLKLLGRVHDQKTALKLLDGFSSGNVNFSVDLMLGLPFSKDGKRNILLELEKILDYGPEHISLYILTPPSNFPYSDQIPDEKWIQDEYLRASDYLREQGFIHYEVSNFARKGSKSRHNMTYWDFNSYAAIGPSACGFLKDKRLRYKWSLRGPEIEPESLTVEQVKLEEFYLALRTDKGVDPCRFINDAEMKKFYEICNRWEKRGLIKIESCRVVLTTRGYLVMDSLLDEVFSRIKMF